MTLPPWSMWVQVDSPGHRLVRVWLPLILLYLLLLPFVLLALSLTILADVLLFIAGRSYHSYTLLLLGCFQLLTNTHGMVIHVRGDDSVVDVSVQ